jgi:hypothetical protein
MRPHPAPKIRDEGLRGASKTMDDNLSVFGKIVETVRPLLHHAAARGEVLGVIVGGADLVNRDESPFRSKVWTRRHGKWPDWALPLLPLDFYRHY